MFYNSESTVDNTVYGFGGFHDAFLERDFEDKYFPIDFKDLIIA